MHALDLQHLDKTYANGVYALRDVSLQVKSGEFFGLLGPNGAGKSTLIGIVSSLVNKTAGKVAVCGYDLDSHPWEAKSNLGLVPQEFNFNAFETVEQILLNAAGYYGVPRRQARVRLGELLHELRLEDKRGSVSRTLSGGMKRRLMIARALMHKPSVLILDEPTAGVDIEVRRSMWTFLSDLNRREGITIILTTHYLEEAESLCRQIAIIDSGRIIEHTDTQSLLRRLSSQAFILDLAEPLTEAPSLSGFDCRLVNPGQIEVVVSGQATLSAVFDQLADRRITVTSLKNRSNRLEALFLRMLEDKSRP